MCDIIISLDETHHIRKNKPLYPDRFDGVQSFHFPVAYAPVKKAGQAFFINTQGKRVFERTFLDAFGFYSRIATVVDDAGFFHIDASGKELYSKRFKWAGNFQEASCVVESSSKSTFFHINSQGQSLYSQRYAYVGDYRYGVAVVTNQQGLCSHIDYAGKALHGKWFLNLDVYHKGYAIAQDKQGYFHIDKQGEPLYRQRYTKLEPFYNGRSAAIDNMGNKLLISTNGSCQKVALDDLIT